MEGYRPGSIGRIAQLHALDDAASNGFGVAFVAKAAKEMGDFCARYQAGRDGLAVDRDVEA